MTLEKHQSVTFILNDYDLQHLKKYGYVDYGVFRILMNCKNYPEVNQQ